MFQKAPDSEENIQEAYAECIAPGVSELNKSSVVCLRVKAKGKVAGAIVHTHTPLMIPIFMSWERQTDSD